MDEPKALNISDENVTIDIPTIVAAPSKEEPPQPAPPPPPVSPPPIIDVETVPLKPVEKVPQPVEEVPQPVEEVPKPVEEVPKPAIDIPEPIIAQADVVGKPKKEKKYMMGIYSFTVLTRKISLSFSEVGSNLFINITKKLQEELEGKCTVEGFIKPETINVVTVSAGRLYSDMVEYGVTFECYICSPVEGMIINKCIVKNVTKAGIRAVLNEELTPVTVFISRDHHYDNEYFATLKEEDIISVKVIGTRYELNDSSISVIANLQKEKKKPRIVLTKPI